MSDIPLKSCYASLRRINRKKFYPELIELGVGYDVTLQGRFDKTPIRIEIEVNSNEGIP